MKITKYFYHHNNSYPYTITFKDIRRIILKIDKNNKIIVSAPFYTSEKTISDFIYENIDKILHMKNKKDEGSKFNISNEKITLLGKNINISILPTTNNNKYKLIGNTLYLYLKDKKDMETVIKRFYKSQAKRFLPLKLELLSRKINLSYNQCTVKWFESKWAHCDSNNNIAISAKLMIQDEHLIDYVLIHELCHTIHHNHSLEFWNLVSKFYPNYKQARKELREL